MADAGYKMDIASTAVSEGKSGNATIGDAGFGDFNFKSASGAASVGGMSPLTMAAAAGVALLIWFVVRKQSRA
mgnify:CR=1 FL=1